MSARVFVDSNVLIYAHDLDAGEKRERASQLLVALWQGGTGVLSTQVLQEFYVNVTRKIANPLPRHQARDLVRRYAVWEVFQNDWDSIAAASELEERYQLSFWDALIVAAAQRLGASKIVTEDLSHGQSLAGVIIQNPFLG